LQKPNTLVVHTDVCISQACLLLNCYVCVCACAFWNVALHEIQIVTILEIFLAIQSKWKRQNRTQLIMQK